MRARRVPLLAALVLACAAAPVLSGHRTLFLSPTRAFSLDGERYALEPSAEGDLSLVRRELARSGIRVEPFGDDPPPHPALAFALRREGGDTVRWRTSLPASFEIRRSLVLQSAQGPVGVAFGETARPYHASRRALASGGWNCDDLVARGKKRCLAARSSGKEAALVLLEEEGRFLVLRRLEK